MFTTNSIFTPKEPLSDSKKNSMNRMRDCFNSEKNKKIALMRQFNIQQSLNWNVSYQKFYSQLQNCNNVYSLLATLFEISQDPLWRNRVSHICIIIKKLHNVCIQSYGGYLDQIFQVGDYERKLINIFYLNDGQVQEHFKNLIKIYLNLNSKYNILNEQSVAQGLLHAGKTQKLHKLSQYLWIISQIQAGHQTIRKCLKIGQDCINSNQSNKLVIILPILTILANYIYNQNRLNILSDLVSNSQFQSIILLSLQTTSDIEICRQALLVCNNILAKSTDLSKIILSSNAILNFAGAINCQEQTIFEKLVSIRKYQLLI